MQFLSLALLASSNQPVRHCPSSQVFSIFQSLVTETEIHTPIVALPPIPARKRNARICSLEAANPQRAVETMKTKFPTRTIGVRPHISEQGDNTKGPSAYVRRNIERTNWRSTSLVMCRSWLIGPSAGAAIDEDRGDRNANDDMIKDVYSFHQLMLNFLVFARMVLTVHFCLRFQFLGFSGSSGPSQVT